MKKTVKTQQNFPFFSALAAVLLVAYLFALVIRADYVALDSLLTQFPFLSQTYFSISMLA